MFIRIVTIKCPNERAKKAFKLLNKEVTEEQMKVGLIKQTTVDASETSIVYVKYWISKKHFDNGRKDNGKDDHSAECTEKNIQQRQ